MVDKLATFAAGALATAAGFYFVQKVKDVCAKKPKMKLKNRKLLLSTRCTWLISELGAESDFNLQEEIDDYPQEPKDPYKRLLSLESKAYLRDSELDGDMPLVPYGAECGSEVVKTDYDDEDFNASTIVVNDEFTMIEGAAVCMYLADTYEQFLPDEEHKAEYYNWIVYSAATFDNIMKTLQFELVDNTEACQDEVALESALNGFHAFARALEDTMAARTYICGENFTAADCVLGFTLWWAYTIRRGKLLKGYPCLMAYLTRLRERPAFTKTFGTEEEWDWTRYFDKYICGALSE